MDWQAYTLTAFALFADQVLRVGQKIEAGTSISWRNLFVMALLLPAFGDGRRRCRTLRLADATVLVVSTSAGWVGFGSMRFVLMIAKTVFGQLASAKVE